MENRCSCGAVGLYKVSTKVFCKAHREDAIKAQAVVRKAVMSKHAVENDNWKWKQVRHGRRDGFTPQFHN